MNTDITLVTGFFDINRSKWKTFSRPQDEYFTNAKRVLSLAHPMVIFIDSKYFDFVREHRKQYDEKYTIVVDYNFNDLKYYQLRNDIKEIMESEDFKQGLVDPIVPEVWNPDYNVVIWSKLDLIMNSINLNPFNSTHYGWIDFGLHKHCLSEQFINNQLVKSPIEDKIRLLCRSKPETSDLNIIKFFKSHCNRFAGGFMTGSINNFKIFYEEQDKLIKEAMLLNVVDCEQSLHAVIYLRHPELFSLYFGDWKNLTDKY